ncbi:MAG: porin [Planctomycetaceae bacterium]|jgi:hypothetical protein|nr:porin [Planctomycetaceae bacterium]
MTKNILGSLSIIATLAVVHFTQTAFAADLFSSLSNPCIEAEDCAPCDEIDTCNKKSRWSFYGVAEAGIFANSFGQKSLHGGTWVVPPGVPIYNPGVLPPGVGNTLALINVRQTDLQLNQLILGGGRSLDSKYGLDWGVHADFAFGTDAIFLQSDGLEFGKGGNLAGRNVYAGQGSWGTGDYYTAIAQAYVELGYKNTSLKIGKFLTPFGSNSAVAPNRFFYSLPTNFALYPATQSGIIGTWDVSKKLSLFGGWTSGIDTECGITGYSGVLLHRGTFFSSSDNNAFLGGLTYKLSDRTTIKYASIIGENDGNTASLPGNDDKYFLQSFVVAVKLSKKWDYTFDWTIANYNTTDTGVDFHSAGSYGINQELIYYYSKKLSLGFRGEWTHSYVNSFWGGQFANIDTAFVNGPGVDPNHYDFSLGASYTPTKNITIRPELRYDKFDGVTPFNNITKDHQLSGGFSTIYKF